jgi:hypothetical protein
MATVENGRAYMAIAPAFITRVGGEHLNHKE